MFTMWRSALSLGRLLLAFSRLASLVVAGLCPQGIAWGQTTVVVICNHIVSSKPFKTFQSPIEAPYKVEVETMKGTENGKVVYWSRVIETVNGETHTGIYTDPGTAATLANGICDSGGHGGLGPPPIGSELRPRTATGTPPVSGQASVASLIVADFNGDGIPDIIQWGFSGVAAITLQAADGSVLSTGSVPIGATSVYGLTGDFNGDGKQDLAIANNDDGLGTGSVWILLGNGDGTFQTAKIAAVKGNPFNIAIGDFNGDGNLDVAVTQSFLTTDDVVWVLLGNGDGSLRSPVSYLAGGALPDSILAADFNNDGNLDLAVSSDGANTFAVLLGKGDGTFKPPLVSPGGTGGSGHLAYDDFNRDGNLDLAIAYQLTNSISMLMGKGDGTFQPAANYVTGSEPDSLAVEPLNDGTFALFTMDQISGNMIVSPGSSDGTLTLPLIHTVGGMPTAVAAADLNGDNIPDVVYYDSASSDVECDVDDEQLYLERRGILSAPKRRRVHGDTSSGHRRLEWGWTPGRGGREFPGHGRQGERIARERYRNTGLGARLCLREATPQGWCWRTSMATANSMPPWSTVAIPSRLPTRAVFRY